MLKYFRSNFFWRITLGIRCLPKTEISSPEEQTKQTKTERPPTTPSRSPKPSRSSQTLGRAATMAEAQREKALSDYRSKLMEHREMDAKLKKMRADCKALTKQYDKSENDLKALQSVGQIVGEVLRYEEYGSFLQCNMYCLNRTNSDLIGV